VLLIFIPAWTHAAENRQSSCCGPVERMQIEPNLRQKVNDWSYSLQQWRACRFGCFCLSNSCRLWRRMVTAYTPCGSPTPTVIGVRGGGRGAASIPVLKYFRANSVFRASASCSKILNGKKYCIFNTVEYYRANSVFLGKVKKFSIQYIKKAKAISLKFLVRENTTRKELHPLELTSKVTTEFGYNGTSSGLYKERYCRIEVTSDLKCE